MFHLLVCFVSVYFHRRSAFCKSSVPTDRRAFHILCQDGADYKVEEQISSEVIQQSAYFRAALSSGFAEAESQCLKKENWTLETAKYMVKLISSGYLYDVKPEQRANLFYAISELALDVEVLGCGKKPILDVAKDMDKIFSSPLLKEDSDVVIVEAEVHCPDTVSRLREMDEPDVAVLPTTDVHIRWKEYDSSRQPRDAYDGVTTRGFETWGLTVPCNLHERHTFSVRFALGKYPTVATALDKLRQLRYGSKSPDEETNIISLRIDAEFLAGKKLNDIKKTLALSEYTGWFDFANDPPTKLKEAMVMCGNEYNKDVKDEEAADFYSRERLALCLCNPSIEVLDNFLCLRCPDEKLYTSFNKYHSNFLWLKTLNFLEQLASSTHTCQPLQKISCIFMEDQRFH